MAENTCLNALMLGDVCGQPGMRALFVSLGNLVKECKADIVVVNGENAADGFGLSVDQMNQLFTLGVDVITSGNHIWQQEDLRPYLDSEARLLRPANYPDGVPGHGMAVVITKKGDVVVLNLQGRQQMPVIDSPFKVADSLVRKAKQKSQVILVDFHAEQTDEKESLAFYLDGKVSAVIGTHTHVQTADEKILPQGTAYLTDMGMCGPRNSVIGSDPSVAIEKQLTQMPLKNPISDEPPMINGVLLSIDTGNGKTLSITRIVKNLTA